MKIPHGQFYSWTTDGNFLGGFEKNASVFEARSHALLFFSLFFLTGVHTAGSGLVQGRKAILYQYIPLSEAVYFKI